MNRLIHTVLISSLLFCAINGQSYFNSHREAMQAARESLNQPVGTGVGFNLMNAANSGIQKIIQLNGSVVNYSMLFDVGSHYTMFIQSDSNVVSQPFKNYTWTPNTYSTDNTPDNQDAYMMVGNLTGYRENISIVIPGVSEFTPGVNSSGNQYSLNLTNYTFFLANNVPATVQTMLANADADGIIGLGLLNGTCRFLEALVNASAINSPSFSLFMTMDPNGVDALSEIIFDDYDTRYANQSFTTVPVSDNSSWSVSVSSASINETQITTGAANAYFSSTFNGLGVPEEIYQNFAGFAQGAGAQCTNFNNTIYCQCNQGQVSSLPDLNFEINGDTYTIAPVYYAQYIPTLQYNNLLMENPNQDLNTKVMKTDYKMKMAIDKLAKNKEFFVEQELGEDTTTTSDSSWSSDDSDYSDWSDSTYTYNYDPMWNSGYFYYSPYMYGWGYYGVYPYWGYGSPIIIYNYGYYNNPRSSNYVPNAGDVCQLSLYSAGNFNLSSSNDWLFGIPFLQSYYTIFSTTPSPNVQFSQSNQPFHFWVDTQVTPTPSSSSHTWLWIVLGLAGFCVLTALMYNCVKNCRNYSNDNGNGNGRKHRKNKKHHHRNDEETVIVTSQINYSPPSNFQPLPNQGFQNQGFPNQGFQQQPNYGYQQPIGGNAYQPYGNNQNFNNGF